MSKERKNRTRRIRNLVVISAMTAIILSVSTYAWFVGMQTVNVSSFDVEIKTTDSLMLSLDGATWSPTVNINKANLADVSYAGNTNYWGGTGLIPMSTVGEMDVNASRMILFEKASYTATAGGYRLLASRVINNMVDPDGAGEDPAVLQSEKDGYVVFDLFVRNFSGSQYIEGMDLLDEEAIYLTDDSTVKVASDGVANTGIENSVRVAFTQIGRVIGTSLDAGLITGITCNSDNNEANPQPTVGAVNGVTGICRDATIWEPNDSAHNENALRWYNTSCRIRTGANVFAEGAYTVASNCPLLDAGTPYDTYAIKAAIPSGNTSVDVYDGAPYNSYAGSGAYLEAFNYFRDSEKVQNGTARPAFMTLAPNSVTKLRVYIYLEGQDIDNYDFATIGKKISVAFGFTKQRFEPTDIGYNGPNLDAYDNSLPVITIAENGDEIDVEQEDIATYNLMTGVTASDNVDGDITNKVAINEGTFAAGAAVGSKHVVKYNVTDTAGNAAIEKYITYTIIANGV